MYDGSFAKSGRCDGLRVNKHVRPRSLRFTALMARTRRFSTPAPRFVVLSSSGAEDDLRKIDKREWDIPQTMMVRNQELGG